MFEPIDRSDLTLKKPKQNKTKQNKKLFDDKSFIIRLKQEITEISNTFRS